MALGTGDRIEEKAHSTERLGRSGVIQEVLREGSSPRYRILWDDGHESVCTPAAGSLAKSRRRRASPRRRQARS
jgi:hypothetical protein